MATPRPEDPDGPIRQAAWSEMFSGTILVQRMLLSASIQIRPFRRTDLRRILEIERATFSRNAYSEELFLALYRDCSDFFFVARRSGRIAGYIVACVAGETAEIVSIAVEPGCRRSGMGTAMMAHTLKKLKTRGVARVRLMVRSTSAASIRFYRMFGFSRAGMVTRYYEDGGDAWRMTKELL